MYKVFINIRARVFFYTCFKAEHTHTHTHRSDTISPSREGIIVSKGVNVKHMDIWRKFDVDYCEKVRVRRGAR